MNNDSKLVRWAKLAIGLLILAGFAFLLGSGAAPPGRIGDVIRNSHAHQIDATALFYSDLDNMQELERDLAERRAQLEKGS